MAIESKKCSQCNIFKTKEYYHKGGYLKQNGKLTLHSWCKECTARIQKISYNKNRSVILNKQRNYNNNVARFKKYGIDKNIYLTMLKEQNNRCKICYNIFKNTVHGITIDHCHKTNKVRGLLCNSCNVGIENFKENTLNLYKAIRYLYGY